MPKPVVTDDRVLSLLVDVLDLHLETEKKNGRLDAHTQALAQIETQILWIIDALKILLKDHPDEAAIAALTAKLTASAASLETAVEANEPQP